jgi:hypothetical protein
VSLSIASGNQSLIGSIKLHSGGLKVVEMPLLHRFEALQQPARCRCILAQCFERKNNGALLGDELKAETDRSLGLPEASF